MFEFKTKYKAMAWPRPRT